MAPPLVSVGQLKSRLDPLFDEHEDAAVVFDADGTLWSHDVGCMVYDAAVEQEAFHESALPALLKEAQQRGVQTRATSANEVARDLQDAWYSREYDERAAAEMQVWAYVGFTESDFREFVRAALKAGKHLETLHDDVIELAAWVRDQGKRACIVSASPIWVVEEAAKPLDFEPTEIAAGIPKTRTEARQKVILPGMAEPLPYGPDKIVAGRRLLGESEWIAALGDSNFDLQMMEVAHLGIGVGGKPALLAGLEHLPHAVRLRLSL